MITPKRNVKQEKPFPQKGSKSKKPAEPELLYYGEHICTTLASRRRADIIRVYCIEERLAQFGELLRWCAKNRKAYHVVSSTDLEKVTGSVHHEGVAVLARAPLVGTGESLLQLLKQEARPIVFLDGVQNPHNIGTIMRVMANFGWPYLVGHSELPSLTAAAARMSEGGAEFVRSFTCADLQSFCLDLKKLGYTLIGTSSHVKESLYSKPLPEKSALILGAEVLGMSAEMESLMDEARQIPGSGQVESLNVAVACGLLLGEYTRTHGLIG